MFNVKVTAVFLLPWQEDKNGSEDWMGMSEGTEIREKFPSTE